MSEKLQLSHYNEFQLSSTYPKDMQSALGILDDLTANDLLLEPRQLDSSEFSEEEQGEKKAKECDLQLLKLADECGYDWEMGAGLISEEPNFKVKKKSRLKKRAKPCQELGEENDKIILSLYKTYGSNWRKIATFFNGMSATVVKNRYYAVLRYKVNKNELGKDEKTKVIIDNRLGERLTGLKTLSDEDRKNKLEGLYQKMNEIEDYIKKTKSEIQTLVIGN